jgi:hypothetical protein
MIPFTENNRFDYNLTPNSWVLMLGGYCGKEAKIFSEKYGCRVVCYEPIKEFYDQLVARFVGTPWSNLIYPVNEAVGAIARTLTLSDLWFPCLRVTTSLATTPVRQQFVHRRKIASASSSIMSLRLLYLMKSSREVITRGRFEIVKTVEPCEEKVWATVWSRPLMIVTTEMTAVTPTIMPTNVSAVRSLFCRRLDAATKNDSQSAATRKRGNERMRSGRRIRLPRA